MKKPLTLDEQILHLSEHKNIVFDDIEVCKNTLLYNNYINLITPFKELFCDNNTKDKTTNKRIYTTQTNFSQYLLAYQKEREQSLIILKNILEFERSFNSVFSYHILTYYNIDSGQAFKKYIKDTTSKCQNKNNKFTQNTRQQTRILQNIKELENTFSKYNDVFILFDRITLGTLKDLYLCSPDNIQKDVFNDLKKQEKVFNTTNQDDFGQKLFDVVGLRNTVAHGNSISIFKKYYDPRKQILRKTNKSIISLIKELSN